MVSSTGALCEVYAARGVSCEWERQVVRVGAAGSGAPWMVGVELVVEDRGEGSGVGGRLGAVAAAVEGDPLGLAESGGAEGVDIVGVGVLSGDGRGEVHGMQYNDGQDVFCSLLVINP